MATKVNSVSLPSEAKSATHASAPELTTTTSQQQSKGTKDASKKVTSFTPVDMDILRSLEHEYSATARQKVHRDQARRMWAWRAGCASALFVFIYLLVGVLVFQSLTDWPLRDTILFCVYTATSAGFGHVDTPTVPFYYVFDSFYIMIGVASMAIMVAEAVQILQLEAERIRNTRTAAQLARQSRGPSSEESRSATYNDYVWNIAERFGPFFRETCLGRFLAVFIPLMAINLTGACSIGAMEGWTFLQSVYFGFAAMTTVGYGDFYPTKDAAVTLCIFWLPFNIVFTSIYMGSVATWYLGLSEKGIERIRIRLHKQHVDKVRFDRSISTPGKEAQRVKIDYGLDDSSVESDNEYFLPAEVMTPKNQSTEVVKADGQDEEKECQVESTPAVVFENLGSTIETMSDVIDVVHKYGTIVAPKGLEDAEEGQTLTPSMKLLVSDKGQNEGGSVPSLALRVLVQERLAGIVAREIAGGPHQVDIQDDFIVVRIGQWKEVVHKWSIPSGAWKPFRAAALECLLLVGEHSMLHEGGPRALFSLSPDEFHSIWSPLVAAMGDAETLKGWLNHTEDMAQTFLTEMPVRAHRKLTIHQETASMPKSQGTAIRNSGRL